MESQQQQQQNQNQPQYNIPVPFITQSEPLGDLIAGITKLFGISQCSPCQKRQEELNRLIGFRPW